MTKFVVIATVFNLLIALINCLVWIITFFSVQRELEKIQKMFPF